MNNYNFQKNSNSRYDLIQKYQTLQNNHNFIITKEHDYAIIVINNALSDDIYNLISTDIPSLKEVFLNDMNRNNQKNNIMLSDHLYKLNVNQKLVKKPLHDILEYHSSRNFNDKIFKIKNEFFLNNNLQSNNSSNIKMTINYISPVCYIPAQMKINNINQRNIIDTINHKIFIWFFMRRDEDNSSGGNFEIYHNDKRVISIPYQKNNLVMLLNNENNENYKNNKFEYSFTSRMTTIHSMRFLDIKL
jgi:hypothetical protein